MTGPHGQHVLSFFGPTLNQNQNASPDPACYWRNCRTRKLDLVRRSVQSELDARWCVAVRRLVVIMSRVHVVSSWC